MSELSLGPRCIDGARVPLFERLTHPPGQGLPRIYDRDGLAVALARALSDIFAVRAPASTVGVPGARRTVIDYGIAETETVMPASAPSRAELAHELTQAVLAFEPRLETPRVKVVPDAEDRGQLHVEVTGRMRLGSITEDFRFVAPLDVARRGRDGQR